MGRDSNPRIPCGIAGFQDRCFRPLSHPSTSAMTCGDYGHNVTPANLRPLADRAPDEA